MKLIPISSCTAIGQRLFHPDVSVRVSVGDQEQQSRIGFTVYERNLNIHFGLKKNNNPKTCDR